MRLADTRPPDPVEVAVDAENPEPVPGRRPRVTARAYCQIERVAPGPETVPQDRQPPRHDR